MKMIFVLLRGYAIKNRKKFLIMIFAISVSTTIIFGTTIARLSQSKYVSDEIYKQSPSYQIEVGNISEEDFETIIKDNNVKSSVLRKYYGNFSYNEKFYVLEEYNKVSFEKLKHTLNNGRFPKQKDEIMISNNLFKELKSQNKLKLIDTHSHKKEYEVELSYSKEYIDNLKEHQIFNQTHKFKIVGTYNMTSIMENSSEGIGIYVYKDFEYPEELTTYNGFIDLKTGFKNVQTEIDKLSIKLDSGELNIKSNKTLATAKEDSQSALGGFDLFDTGTIVASICIIFNVFNIMMKELVQEIGLLRVVGMSKRQSLFIFMLKNILVLLVGSLIGFLGGYLLAEVMIKYFNLTSGFIDVSDAPIYVSKSAVFKTLKLTISMLLISTILPILITLKSYPVNMMSGRLRNPINIFDEIFNKIKIYGKLKILGLNFLKKIRNLSKLERKLFFRDNVDWNIALNNSKRNSIYILTTAIIVGMAGLYGVRQFITSQQVSSIGDPLLQRLGDYSIDLSYNGISKLDDSLISQQDLDNISSIDGVSDVYKFNSTTAYAKIKTKDLSSAYRKNLSIKDDNREIEMKFDFIGLNKDALSKYDSFLDSGQLYKKNNNVIEAVVSNYFLDQTYTHSQQKYSEKLKIGDTLKFKVLSEENGVKKYNNIEIKIVGFLSEEWFTKGTYTNSQTPDIIVDSSDYKKITGDNNFSQVKIKVEEQDLENIKLSIENILKDKKYIKYSDKNTINQEQGSLAWQTIIRNIVNSAMLSITALINIVFSVVTSITMRKKELGLMRAIGLSIKDLKRILMYEGLIYGVISSTVGVLFILYKGISWVHLLKMTAKFQGIPYEGPLFIFPVIPTLVFILSTIIISLISVTFTFKIINKYSIVNQIREN
ncbi:TPA: FtsX-like permease family protein [Clostridioides difficile]|uniref:ABC transporter permease n=2 Tax=Clostridioides difficile TaxID=1496 RepID=UPI000D1D6689|nr:FtsX-like permease family protein [Clostridioides difficile]HBE9571381.1 FtsX-like permease family protein [Clostridioides difficile]